MTNATAELPPPPPFYREPLSVGSVALASRFNLAPLAGYTNLPFRLSVRELGGVGLCTTDLINARAIVDGIQKTMLLLAHDHAERPLFVQIFGSKPHEMAGAAKWLVENRIADGIDINMGCPVRKVVKTGGGSSLMCDTTGATVGLVSQVVEAVRPVPVSVKMRLGWDDDNLSAPYFAREFEKAGVAALTIHGRTREQGFAGGVNHEGIRRVVEAVEKIPVFGNGDVRSVQDAARMITETGCHGIAIGRGALANPWVFRQFDAWVRTGDPGPRATYAERLAFMRLHLKRLVDWRGSERNGCVHFRKVATWYTKALRFPKKVQQRLVMLSTLAEFEELIAPFSGGHAPDGWTEYDAQQAHIAVPAGPIAHW
ncbi:tRNA dihydrouridine synthase DusB [Gemmata sp. JC673]|uniref:tRNA-dihydrouridine synthase n=1 Tax=Gemmata algarum TaxID=2975278 RepID=A0ABU5F901_9BACT|nr:tRNA dihydrouridine synthase DusB [Gemmata algarum]MDY3563237.1 tRNA dihydrouridine synthase DusB [Gemmata algarum]